MKKSSLFIILILVVSASFTSCYTYHLVASPDPAELVPQRETSWSFFWGLVRSKDKSAECPEETIANVKVDMTFFHSLLTVGSAGTVSPMTIEWHCAPEKTSDDTLEDDQLENKKR